MSDALAAFVRWVMRGTTFHRIYVASVELQHADGRVDLAPEDDAVRGLGLKYVPVPTGIAVCRVEPGTRCLFGFDDGNPSRPRVRAWEYSRDSATLKLAAGAAALARAGDAIKVVAGPAPIVVSGLGDGTVTNPGPPPFPQPVPMAPFTATITLPPGFTVYGVLQRGAPRVRA